MRPVNATLMDAAVFRFLYSLSGESAFTQTVVVFFAEYLPYLTLGLAVFFILRTRGLKRRIFYFIFIALNAILAKGVIVDTFWFFHDRVRPFKTLADVKQLIYAGGPSFPSGHASLFFALAFSIFYLNKRWGIFFGLIAFFIGVARVVAGLHWPSDIAGGVVAGAAAFGLTWLLMRRINILKSGSAISE